MNDPLKFTEKQPSTTEDGGADAVRELLALGKCKQAVELAKEHHKLKKSVGSERMLVQAYVARIEEFYGKGMGKEALTLLELVQQRYPAQRHQLDALEVVGLAMSGRLGDLLRPLKSDQVPARTKELIENVVARQITDLPALAACDALPVEHPLRTGAAAVWKAFVAVTTGPVTDAEMALSDISRRSPFAAWKMVIRAIAAFYRKDDEGCRRALDSIPDDAAVAPVARAVRSLVDGKKLAAGIAGVIYSRVSIDDEPLRNALEKIESSLSYTELAGLTSGIREATRLCAASRPQLLERLRQQISIACVREEVPLEVARSVLGSTRKDAYFWHLMARMAESDGPAVISAIYWERFLRHAVDEGMFIASDRPAAIVWLHIADILSTLSLAKLQRDLERVKKRVVIGDYYVDQLREISRLKPASDHALYEQILQPGHGYLQAAKINAEPETFVQWWNWAERVNLPTKRKEDIALQWRQHLPRDVRPLVNLAQLAESRNALSMAMKRLVEAEAIDPLNLQVRQARVRLTLSIAWRHFADGKAHLVEKDLTDLAALPGMGEGDKSAVLESMRGAWHAMRQDPSAEASALASVIHLVGPIAGQTLFYSIKLMAKLIKIKQLVFPSTNSSESLEIAQAHARLLRLTDNLNLKIFRPMRWNDEEMKVLNQSPCPLSNDDVLLLGRGAIEQSAMYLAYQASTAGLSRAASPAGFARFLLLRAKSLNRHWHQPRTTQCLRAAIEFARQAHDEELIREVFSAIDNHTATRQIIANSGSGQGLSPQRLQAVLDIEKQAVDFPKTDDDIDAFTAEKTDDFIGSRFGGFDASDFGEHEDDDDDDEFDGDDDDSNGFGLFDSETVPKSTPQIRTKLEEVLRQSGIDSPEQMMDNPRLMIEAMAKAMGKNIDPTEIDAIVDELTGASSEASDDDSGPFGGPPSNRKKRRR